MFKRDLKIYLVTEQGTQYRLPVYTDVSYSQVYSEKERDNKTLHNPENKFTTSYTTYLNPGNFSFTIPILHDSIMGNLVQVALGETPFDIYIESPTNTLKLTKSICDSLVFNTPRNELITLTIGGSFSKAEDIDLPVGTLETFTFEYTTVEQLQITLNSIVQSNINNFSMEFSRNVQWVNRNFMQDNAPSFSEDFVISKHNITGNFSVHEDLEIPTYGTQSINILINSGGFELLQVDLPSVTYSTRGQLDEILKTGIDYKANLANNQILYKGVNIL